MIWRKIGGNCTCWGQREHWVKSMFYQWFLNYCSTSSQHRWVLNASSVFYRSNINYQSMTRFPLLKISIETTLMLVKHGENIVSLHNLYVLYGYWGDIDQILMPGKHRENIERELFSYELKPDQRGREALNSAWFWFHRFPTWDFWSSHNNLN